MKGKILFSEQQKIREPWIWVILFFVFGGLVAASLIDLLRNGDEEAILGVYIMLGAFTFITLLFAVVKLDVVITTEGINIKFSPFHRSYRNYRWEEVVGAKVVKYSPVTYRGWGVKMRGRTTAYNFFSSRGLLLELRNGRRIMIGTKKRLELEHALEKIKQEKF